MHKPLSCIYIVYVKHNTSKFTQWNFDCSASDSTVLKVSGIISIELRFASGIFPVSDRYNEIAVYLAFKLYFKSSICA